MAALTGQATWMLFVSRARRQRDRGRGVRAATRSPLDSILRLTDAKGQQVAINDDHEDKGAGLLTTTPTPGCVPRMPADGTYYLQISDSQHAGGPEYGYRLRLGPPQPDSSCGSVARR